MANNLISPSNIGALHSQFMVQITTKLDENTIKLEEQWVKIDHAVAELKSESEMTEQSLQMDARFDNFCATFHKKLEQQASSFDGKLVELVSQFDAALKGRTANFDAKLARQSNEWVEQELKLTKKLETRVGAIDCKLEEQSASFDPKLMEHATDLHNGQPPSYHQIDY